MAKTIIKKTHYGIASGMLVEAIKSDDYTGNKEYPLIRVKVKNKPYFLAPSKNIHVVAENHNRTIEADSDVVLFCNDDAQNVIAVCSREFYDALNHIEPSTTGKINAIDGLVKLDPDPRMIAQFKKNWLRAEPCESSEDISLLYDIDNLRFYFEFQKNCYSNAQYSKIQSLFSDYDDAPRSDDANRAKNMLTMIASIDPGGRSASESVNVNDISSTMDCLPISDEIKGAIIQNLVSYVYAQKRSRQPSGKLLLVGNDDRLLDYIASVIAKALNKKTVSKNCKSISCAVVNIGLSSDYSGSHCGWIAEAAVQNHGIFDLLFHIQSLDCCSDVSAEAGSVQNGLETLFSTDYFCDDWFRQYPFSTRGSFILATANDYESVAEPLRNAFGSNVIRIPPLSKSAQEKLFNELFAAKLREYGLSDYSVSPNALYEMLYVYSDGRLQSIEEVSQRLAISLLTSNKTYKRIDIKSLEELLPTYSGEENMLFFRQNRERYNSEQYDEIFSLQNQIDNCKNTERRFDLIEKRNTLIGLIDRASDSSVDLCEARAALDENFYGQEKLKSLVFSKLSSAAFQELPVNSICLLLWGEPGVGKTKFAEMLAQAIGRGFAKVSMNGLHDLDLKGSINKAGAIEAAAKATGTSAVFLLDEVDKMHDFNSLCDLLDYKVFQSRYFRSKIDYRNAIFILSANEIDDIPNYVKSRCEIVHMNGYSQREKEEIAKLYLKQYNETVKNKVSFDDLTIGYAVMRSLDVELDGVRKLGQIMNDAINNACSEAFFAGKKIRNVEVTRSHVEDAMEKLDTKPKSKAIGFCSNYH